MGDHDKIAVWAVTPNGADLAEKIAERMPAVDLFCPQGLPSRAIDVQRFTRLKKTVEQCFKRYPAHIFVMSTGIVVRLIAPLIRHKTEDPAVLVIDERGLHVISLLSGHMGGANALALEVSDLIDSDPVITTATDINAVPAVDILAAQKNLFIENPAAIKYVNMAMVTGNPIFLHDPYNFLTEDLNNMTAIPFETRGDIPDDNPQGDLRAGVFIDDITLDLPDRTLILRPPSLVAGIGCNRNTGLDELKGFLVDVLEKSALSPKSLKGLSSIDVKSDESGLSALAKELDLPIQFFTRKELNSVETIQNPSTMVEKHVGVKSVCEAAAILGSNQGQLIVPKQNTRNVTVAIARTPFTS